MKHGVYEYMVCVYIYGICRPTHFISGMVKQVNKIKCDVLQSIMLSCVLFVSGSFDAKAQSEVQRILGCEIELSKNEWYEIVYIYI